MQLKSVLKTPESSVMVGLAEAGLVYVIYQTALPNHADIRSADPHNNDIEAVRKAAAWKCGAVIGLMFFFTHDVNSAVIAMAAVAGMDYMVKHSNGINPSTGKLAGGRGDGPGAILPADNDTAFSMPDYTDGQPEEGSY